MGRRDHKDASMKQNCVCVCVLIWDCERRNSRVETLKVFHARISSRIAKIQDLCFKNSIRQHHSISSLCACFQTLQKEF